MKKIIYLLFILLLTSLNAKNENKPFTGERNNTISFTENKGQVYDQNFKARPDVLYGAMAGDMAFHLKTTGLSYQLYRTDSYKEIEDFKTKEKRKQIDQQTIYRVDLNWLNHNLNFKTINDEALQGYNNYYLESCPNGALNVKSYKGVICTNLYNGINLHYYEKNGELKHDYIVAPHANYKQIQLEVKGAGVSIAKDGSLMLNTPLSKIQEGAPMVYQNGKQLKANWLVKNNIISFEIENYNPSMELIIDPVTRIWGTYYGGSGDEEDVSSNTDAIGNVYLAGTTQSGTSTLVATSGAHQTTFGGATRDAYIVKFNSNGVRQWGTYYGGAADDHGRSCAIDNSGFVYLGGNTFSNSSTVIATAGSHQSTASGGTDGFLVKFNSIGVRQWGTYYGGAGNDFVRGVCLDQLGNVFLSGNTSTNSGTLIATVGSHQNAFGGAFNDGFLVKFNSSGVRQWGTYYGGSDDDFGFACSTDNSNNVFLVGHTASNSGTTIATPSSHQPNHSGGGWDGFLVKFNNNGIRQWGTYYGGNNNADWAHACCTDQTGNIFMAGSTDCATGTIIATSAAHQPTIGGGFKDGFLVKFDGTGVRQWGTYFGGSSHDEAWSCATNTLGEVFLAGFSASNSSTVIATTNGFQSFFGGGYDAFLAKFSSNGTRQLATYYGGSGNDRGYRCCVDNLGGVYLAGYSATNTGTTIASIGSHQSAYGGGTNDAYLVKFNDCILPSNPTNTTLIGNQMVCLGNTTTLSAANSTNIINWYTSPTSTTVLGTGVNYITPTLTAGSYTYYAEAFGCEASLLRTPITLTVNLSPTITVNSGSICSGQSFTINPSGASTYTIQGGNAVVSPAFLSTYTVIGTNTAGCVSQTPATSTVAVFINPVISVNSGSICPGNSFTITPTGAITYTIQGGAALVSPTVSSTYTIIGTNSNGCISQSPATSTVTVNPNPTITVNSGSICSGNSFTISPSGANTYTIQGGSSVVSPTSNSTYTLIGTSTAGCISQGFATSSVTVNSNPTVTINSGTICSGNSFTLTPIGANTYTIQGGNTIVSPSISTTYTVTGANSAGCVSQNFATSGITVNPNPTITAVSNASLICVGQTATLTASGAISYTWNTTATSVAIAVSPAITTTFTVNGMDANGCQNTAMITQSVSACTGLDNLLSGIQRLAFKVYPNPSNGNFEIDVEEIADLKICDATGRIVLRQKVTIGKNTIDISSYANGIYFLNATGKTKSYNGKVIKQ